MIAVIAVGVGGAIGAVARYLLAFGISSKVPTAVFPAGTLAVNVIGCLCMGIAIGILGRFAVAKEVMLFTTTGVLGGFTTFSAFGLETVQLLSAGRLYAAAFYVTASIIGSVALLIVGLKITGG